MTVEKRQVKKMITKEYFYGDGKYQISLQVTMTDGNGLCCFLTGGQKPHLGGTVVSAPREKSSAIEESDRTADFWVSSVPGHKDVEAAIPIAKYLAVTLNEPVSVSAGIHIENAKPDEIRLLCGNCKKAAEIFVEEYKKHSF
ncbi:MAG: hypothetical protein Q4B70_07370 [Lachnospiraceae bacterium]|nr:hypothetical protein [Lachnospiraceae bacterium]